MYGTLERYWWNTYAHENVQKLFQGRENSKKNKTLFLDDQKKKKKISSMRMTVQSIPT